MSALQAIHHIPSCPHLYVVRESVAGYERGLPLPAAVYWRRRAYALALVALTVVTVWAVASSAMRYVSGDPAGASPQTPTQVQESGAAPTYWTVRPGDTLWSIANSVKPEGDIRPVLSKLQKAYSNTPLIPGTVIQVS